MFFNNSEEGIEWWTKQKLWVTLPDEVDEHFLDKYLE